MHQLYYPEMIALVGDAVYVADKNNHRVVKWAPAPGHEMRQLRPETFGKYGDYPHQGMDQFNSVRFLTPS